MPVAAAQKIFLAASGRRVQRADVRQRGHQAQNGHDRQKRAEQDLQSLSEHFHRLPHGSIPGRGPDDTPPGAAAFLSFDYFSNLGVQMRAVVL